MCWKHSCWQEALAVVWSRFGTACFDNIQPSACVVSAWRRAEKYLFRSHDSPESPPFPEHSHRNRFTSIRQRSSFLSDKSAEYIWNSGKGAVSTWGRHYPSCQAKTMTQQCRILKSFDTHPETMAAGLSVKHSDRITFYRSLLYLM